MNPIPVIIPARGGSKGIPRKNVLPLAGKPLLAHVVQAASACSLVSSVWVTTDDDEIAAVAEAHGASVIRRPADLAGDQATSESALLHALEAIEKRQPLPSAFCFMQCTSPLTSAEDLERGIRHFQETRADSLLSVTPNHRFLWKAGSNGFEGINHDAAVRKRRQDLPPEYAENGAFYIMRTEAFRERQHRFFGRVEVCVMDAMTGVEIDEPADFAFIEALLASRSSSRVTLDERLARLSAIVFDFDGVFTDDRVWVDENGKESAACSRSDGMGISLLKKAFHGPLLILSREINPIVRHRAAKLGLECLHGVEDKLTVLQNWASEHHFGLDRMAYVGNDVNDLECLRAVGVSVCPQDSHESVLVAAQWTLSCCGGKGAVREFCDRMLSALEKN